MVGYGVKAAAATLAALLAAGPAVAGGPGPRDCDCAPHPHGRVVERLVPVTYYEAREVYVPQRVYVQRRGYVRTQFYLVDQGPSFGVPAVPYTQPVIYQVGVRVSPAEAARMRPAPHRHGYRKGYRRHMHGGHRHGMHRHGMHRQGMRQDGMRRHGAYQHGAYQQGGRRLQPHRAQRRALRDGGRHEAMRGHRAMRVAAGHAPRGKGRAAPRRKARH